MLGWLGMESDSGEHGSDVPPRYTLLLWEMGSMPHLVDYVARYRLAGPLRNP